jgi:hypothetical protein
VLAAALAASGCHTGLGRSIPACDQDRITNTLILEAQSVRGAAYAPCVEELPPGWEYEHMMARSGEARFWISSDRVGDRFLEVRFEESCDVSGAREAISDEEGIPRFVEDLDVDFRLPVTLIPEGDVADLVGYTESIALDIWATRVQGRLVRVAIDDGGPTTAERIRAALDDGDAALVVGPRDLEEGTVELHLPGGKVSGGLSIAEALDEAADRLGEPTYRSDWYYPFTNGCVTYLIDAEGPGVERVAPEVLDAVGFIDLGWMRGFGEQYGYVLP